jgi:hypothetical protein
MTKAALHPAQQDRLSAGEQPHQNWCRTHGSIGWEIALPETQAANACKIFLTHLTR